MKWWFNKYLPSQLLKQFPDLEETPLADNPVVGIGCQTIYDINDDIVYFCKRDYKLKDQYVGDVVYTPEDGFIYTFGGDPVETPNSGPEYEKNYNYTYTNSTNPSTTGPVAGPVKPTEPSVPTTGLMDLKLFWGSSIF
ncbi:MAG: hypothetical protein CM15mV42_0620 [uncultured marine virus]|nr:MAG: hypothetical protein CM15mV42_0620 [uncultured marine virus]